jgi:hypothetical protein
MIICSFYNSKRTSVNKKESVSIDIDFDYVSLIQIKEKEKARELPKNTLKLKMNKKFDQE